MPLAFLLVGLGLVVVAIRGTQAQLATQLGTDLPAFLPWIGAIGVIGGLGYVPDLRKVSNALLILIGVVLLLGNGKSFWTNVTTAFTSAPTPVQGTSPVPTQPLGGIPVQFYGAATSASGAAAGGLSLIPGM